MKTIIYCADGEPVSDFNYLEWLNRFTDAPEGTIFKVSTEVACNIIRCEIVNDRIDYKNVMFRFGDNYFQANEYGAILKWPKGFCEVNMDLSSVIIHEAMKKRRAIRAAEAHNRLCQIENETK